MFTHNYFPKTSHTPCMMKDFGLGFTRNLGWYTKLNSVRCQGFLKRDAFAGGSMDASTQRAVKFRRFSFHFEKFRGFIDGK